MRTMRTMAEVSFGLTTSIPFRKSCFLLNAVASKFAMATAKAKQNIQELFEKFDTSGDGTLQLDEMAEVFSALILVFFFGGTALGWSDKWHGCKAGNLGRAADAVFLQVIFGQIFRVGFGEFLGYWVLFASGSSKTPGG